jgi:hypothetical protein
VSGFDTEKDKTFKEDSFSADGGKDQSVEVKLVSYDGGPKKIQLSRFDQSGDGRSRKYLRLGRMTLVEAAKVVEIVAAFLKEA